MKIARIEHEGRSEYAVVSDEGYAIIEGDVFGQWTAARIIPVAEARLLAPVTPPQVIAIGANYRAHCGEMNKAAPERPCVFYKPITAIIGPGEPILLPKMAPDEVDYEAELGVVIGKKAKHVPEDEVDDIIFGYTCCNDVSARDCQHRLDLQWARGKGFDTFAPVGPWIETDLDPSDIRVRLTLNGREMQNDRTANMIFPVRYLVSYLSQCMTLLPGSLILTGTPRGVGAARDPQVFLREGDEATVSIDGLGELTNPVRREA